MQFTPTVISAQPLEKAILEYLDRNDRVGLEHFLSTRRAPDIADIVDRLPEREQTKSSRCCRRLYKRLFWPNRARKLSEPC